MSVMVGCECMVVFWTMLLENWGFKEFWDILKLQAF